MATFFDLLEYYKESLAAFEHAFNLLTTTYDDRGCSLEDVVEFGGPLKTSEPELFEAIENLVKYTSVGRNNRLPVEALGYWLAALHISENIKEKYDSCEIYNALYLLSLWVKEKVVRTKKEIAVLEKKIAKWNQRHE